MIRPLNNDWPRWRFTQWPCVARWRNALSGPTALPDRLMLWVDSVGGYLLCLRDEVSLGRPAEGGTPDVPILGDLSRRQAILRRQGEGYAIEAVQAVRLNGQPVQRTAPLWDGSLIELGEGVRIRFCRPHPLSATARLEFLSGHRTQPSTDGVLLMAESCILGPATSSHVVTPRWRDEVVLYRQGGQLRCRTATKILVDGAACQDRSVLRPRSHVEGDEFAFSLEPIVEN